MSDDDWFERALREDEDDDSDSDSDDNVDSDADETETEPTTNDGDADPASDFETTPDSDAASDFDTVSDSDSTPDLDPAQDPEPTIEPETEADLPDTDDDSPDGGFPSAESDESSDDELFDDDFATAFQNAPGGGPDGGADAGFGTDGASGGDGDFGMGGGGDDFGMGGDDGFGMGGEGFGGGDEPFEGAEFDDEEFESSIPRIDIGIEGLDSMIHGGVPERSLITTIGSAGTGKTTFGLQFLHEALEAGESAVFITLEESRDRIVNTATEKGWEFDEYEADEQLAVIDLDPIEMANSLTSIRNDLPRLVEEFGASRLVLDSVSLLEMMYDEQATRRNEIYDFTKSLKEAGVTTMLTSEASEDSPYASRHGIIEYLVDAVFVLRYIRSSDDFRETRLAVEIQKIRDANHSREIKPYSITDEGISVYRQANIF